jgi:TM2 domain-containing membrane protein YozV
MLALQNVQQRPTTLGLLHGSAPLAEAPRPGQTVDLNGPPRPAESFSADLPIVLLLVGLALGLGAFIATRRSPDPSRQPGNAPPLSVTSSVQGATRKEVPTTEARSPGGSDRIEALMFHYAQRLPDDRRGAFMLSYCAQKRNRTTALVLSLFLGVLGLDRFYLDQVGAGVLKLLTLGGLGLWAFVDWFLIMGAADRHNLIVLNNLSLVYPRLKVETGGPMP